ncbi:hypothetical protein ABEB36_010270 [Hypothenemus hampei]|uniref:THAP-type domain-containing protein n=1 Tax=Hypothenemus hampei TaxID=57062 RepID=A0ABD1EJL7_HYPHA
MSDHGICLVCGYKNHEVKKLHYFPRNINKSKTWQEAMGIQFVGTSLRNYRICNRHFNVDSYKNLTSHELRLDAIPTLFSAKPSCSLINDPPVAMSDSTQWENQPIKAQEVAKYGIFKKRNITPRESKLMNIIIKKEGYIRKLKYLSKKRGRDLKALSNLAESNEVRNIKNIYSNFRKVTMHNFDSVVV